MQRLFLLGLNHTTAPLEVREKLAFANSTRDSAIEAFRAKYPACEIVLLSTCNRVELYTAREPHGHPRVEEIINFLADIHGVPPAAFSSHLYQKSDRAVVEHVFTVASSLDSMVLGETQILGQVREAYDAARARGATGAMLNPLFQRAIAVGKQVMHETPLAEGRTSIASVAVDYARRIFDTFDDKTVLSIGAGKMAALVLQSFAALKPGTLLVCNRDLGKAEALAGRFGGSAMPFEQLGQHLSSADIVVTSTGSTHPIISKKLFDAVLKQRRYKPVFIIDIALPRDVEPAVGDADNVYLYNLDDLQQVVSQTRSQRTEATDSAARIIGAGVEQFALAHRAREMGPVIDRLYKRYHEVAQDEVARTLGKLPSVSEAERAHLEELARRIVNKLLHDPVQMLKTSDNLHAGTAQYLHAMEMLFGLKEDGSE